MVNFTNSSGFVTNRRFANEERSSANSILLRIAFTAALLALITAVEYQLFYGLGFQFPSLVYVVGIIVAATWFGTGYGIFCAVASVLLCAVLFDNRPFSLRAGNDANLATAFILVSAATLVGIYAGLIRERFSVARILSTSHSASGADAQSKPDAIAVDGLDTSFDWKGEGQNIAVATLMVVCACVFTVAFTYIFQIERTLSFFVAAILITAITRGARAAMAAAILAVIAFNLLSSGLHLSIAIDTIGDLVNFLIFAGIAWWVGSYADRVRQARRTAQILFDASQMFSTMSDEGAIRLLLLKSVAELCGTSAVWVVDEHGKSLNGDAPVPKTILTSTPWRAADNLSPWRMRHLQVDDRALGSVIWFGTKAVQKDASAERVVTVLADLAASAITRARLTAVQVDMQLVAQGEKLRTALLSSISHDFRTPLSGILGAATGLLELGESYDTFRRQDLLLTVRNQAVRLNRYIENLLSMMQLENGALKVRSQQLLVEPLVYDAWEALGDSGGSLRILDVRIQDDAVVFADRFLFTQVLTNLFENAIKYTPEGSPVIVRGRTSGPSQLIEIVDAGPGVVDVDLTKIFNRFYRGAKPKSVGLGLGLYITKALLEAMYSSVEARNRADGTSGLIMSITMPISEGHQ